MSTTPEITILNASGAPSTTRGVPVTMNASELDTARGLFDRTVEGMARKPESVLNQSKALSVEVAARDWVKSQYGARAEVVAAIRRGEKGAPVFDYLFRTGRNEFVLLEAKTFDSKLGFTVEKVLVQSSAGVSYVSLPGEVEQLSGKWIEQRIAELRASKVAGATELGNELDRSWRSGRLRVLLARGHEKSMATLSEVVDYTDEANAYVGAEARHEIPAASAVGSEQSGVKVSRGVSSVKSTAEQRVLATQNALLKNDLEKANKDVTALTNKAKQAESKAATAEKRVAATEQKLKELAAKQAKPNAKASPKTQAKLDAELAERKAARDALKREAQEARSAIGKAESDVKGIETQIRERQREIDRLETLKPPRPIRPVSGTPIRPTSMATSTALDAERAEVRAAERMTSKVDHALVAERKVVGAVKAVEKLGKVAKAVRVAKTVYRLTKTVGKIAVVLFLPITPLEITIEIVLWLEARVAERQALEAEWARIVSFLFEVEDPVKDRFTGIYAPTVGQVFWNAVNQRLDDEQDPQNMTTWLTKWDADRHRGPGQRYSGFVYAKTTAEVIRQEHTPSLGSQTTDRPIRFFLRSPLPRPELSTWSAKATRWKKELTSPRTVPPESKDNLFTLGEYGNPANKPDYDIAKHTDYLAMQVTTVDLRVHAMAPWPCVTPFHFLIYKTRDLFLEIVRYVSKFDEDFIALAPLEDDASGVFVNWYQDIRDWPRDIDGDVARESLWKLGKLLEALKTHVAMPGDTPKSAFERRLALVRIAVPPNRPAALKTMATRLSRLAPDDLGEDDYVKYRAHQDPELAYLHKETLVQLAMELHEDFQRVHEDMTSSNPALPYQYRYGGSWEGW